MVCRKLTDKIPIKCGDPHYGSKITLFFFVLLLPNGTTHIFVVGEYLKTRNNISSVAEILNTYFISLKIIKTPKVNNILQIDTENHGCSHQCYLVKYNEHYSTKTIAFFILVRLFAWSQQPTTNHAPNFVTIVRHLNSVHVSSVYIPFLRCVLHCNRCNRVYHAYIVHTPIDYS